MTQPTELSAANKRALDGLMEALRERVLLAQRAGENVELEFTARLRLLHGEIRAVRYWPDERLSLDKLGQSVDTSHST